MFALWPLYILNTMSFATENEMFGKRLLDPVLP